MANIKSSEKRAQIAERNRQRNVAAKSAIKTAIKKVNQAVETKAAKDALQTQLSEAYSIMDRAVLKGILHKNTVARYKSRLTKKVAS